MLKRVVLKLGDIVRRELIFTSKMNSFSLFQKKDLGSLQFFKWNEVCRDFQRTAPYLGHILEKCAEAKRSATHSSNKDIVISVVVGILLRNCSQRANLIQRLLSILLYSSHVPKNVSK